LVLKQSGLDFLKVQGLVGLSPSKIVADESGSMFLEELKRAGSIDHESFSISI
jgi:hypothetical protein